MKKRCSNGQRFLRFMSIIMDPDTRGKSENDNAICFCSDDETVLKRFLADYCFIGF